jgi:hypothetical protein
MSEQDEEQPKGCCGRMSAGITRFKTFLSKHFCDFCATVPTIALVIFAIVILLLLLSIIPIAILTTMKGGNSSVVEPSVKPGAEPFERGDLPDTDSLVPPNVTACNGHGFSCVGVPVSSNQFIKLIHSSRALLLATISVVMANSTVRMEAMKPIVRVSYSIVKSCRHYL